jgi:Bacteriophage HK97-gp10, putative tail-component
VPYEGDDLMDLIENLEEATKRTGHRLADAMTDRGKTNIERNTPVETRHLRDSLERTPIRYRRFSLQGVRLYCWEGKVFTEVEYAEYVERGTGLWGPRRKKYKIEPKKPGGVLAFTPYARMPNGGVILDVQNGVVSGQPVYARYVMHPGSPGAHMFRIGATLTEHQFDEFARDPMRLWKEEVEGRAGRLTASADVAG